MKRVNDTLIELLDSYTGEYVTFSKVAKYTDGSNMNDAKCDGVIYRKLGNEYFKRNFTGPVNVKWFGAKCDGVTDDTTAVTKANYSCKMYNQILYFPAFCLVYNVRLSCNIFDHVVRIFSNNSTVIIDNNSHIRPEWFGDDIYAGRKAIDSLPDNGGVILLQEKEYLPFYPPAFGNIPHIDYIAKPNVSIIGAKNPNFGNPNTVGVFQKLLGGTIIKGNIPVFAENFHIENLGIDVGKIVIDNEFSGINQEGLIVYKPGQDVSLPNVKGFSAENITVLCSDKYALIHCFLFEAIDGGMINNIRSFGGTHGIVIKSKNISLNNFYSKYNGGEGLIIKSDSYSVCENVNVSNGIVIGSPGGEDHGVLLLGNYAAMNSVNISGVNVSFKRKAIQIENIYNRVHDVNISNINSDMCEIGVNLLGDIVRCRFHNIKISNSLKAINVKGVTSKTNSISNLSVAVSEYGISSDSYINIGDCTFEGISNSILYYDTSTSKINIKGGVSNVENIALWNLYVPLINGWGNHGGTNNPDFKIKFQQIYIKD